MTIQVRQISAAQHLAFLEDWSAPGSTAAETVSFLQTPAWGRVKKEWRSESIGVVRDDSELIGVGLVLYRQVPRLRRYLAYLPEGPVLDWSTPDLPEVLSALRAHVKGRGAFALRIGPTLPHRTWRKDTIKEAIADEGITALSQAPADVTNRRATYLANQLRHLGWRPPRDAEGFAAGQPKFNFQLPLVRWVGGVRTPLTADEVLAGMNQLWRRNIKKAAKKGVEVVRGTRDDLPAFHEVYLETATRDGFTPRPLEYFETMWDALNGEDPDRMHLYLARHEGDVVAATTWVHVGRHTWYSYGASTNAKRDVRGSNAIQWRMIEDSLAVDADVYDLRGITEGLAADDPELGLIQFKVGSGGEAVSYIGEWDLVIDPVLYTAFDLYMNRRNR